MNKNKRMIKGNGKSREECERKKQMKNEIKHEIKHTSAAHRSVYHHVISSCLENLSYII